MPEEKDRMRIAITLICRAECRKMDILLQ